MRRIVIPGEPRGKGRPRFTRSGHTYTPTETAEYEDMVRAIYMQQYGRQRISDETPIRMVISAFYKIPKSASKKKRSQMIEYKIRPTKKPDLDNIIKIVSDALNGIAYKDDTSIVEIKCCKSYSEEPKVIVKIEEVQDEG